MKYLSVLLALALMAFVPVSKPSIHAFKVESIDGGVIDFSKFKGKKILVVNTASKCGYTYQYEGLEKLYDQYKDKLVIVGFPANNFGGQEPGSNAEVKEFCTSKFDVSFPMAAKVSVRAAIKQPSLNGLLKKLKMVYSMPTLAGTSTSFYWMKTASSFSTLPAV